MTVAIFLSYRSEDQAVVDQIQSELAAYFGSAQVFLDRRDLQAGMPFAAKLEQAVRDSLVLVLVIGPAWGSRSAALAQADDWVRRELDTARAAARPVLPVRIGVPFPRGLPPELGWLADTHALLIEDSTWQRGVSTLIAALESAGVPRPVRAAFSETPASKREEARGVWLTRMSYASTKRAVRQQTEALGWRIVDDTGEHINVEGGNATWAWLGGSGLVGDERLPIIGKIRVAQLGVSTCVEVLLKENWGHRPARPKARFRVLLNRAVEQFRGATAAEA